MTTLEKAIPCIISMSYRFYFWICVLKNMEAEINTDIFIFMLITLPFLIVPQRKGKNHFKHVQIDKCLSRI